MPGRAVGHHPEVFPVSMRIRPELSSVVLLNLYRAGILYFSFLVAVPDNGHEVAKPFFKPDPLNRVLGPSSAGNRPEIDENYNATCQFPSSGPLR